jgi:alpha-methylacyl-CoA racemase
MLLADMGAEILRIDQPGHEKLTPPHEAAMLRGRVRLELDLKDPQQQSHLLSIITHASILIEGMRPGVMERLGLAPDKCLELNPKLVIGRMTGWGQEGPMAQTPGHDPNYLALSGALHAMGYADRPPLPPLNLVGDYGGGALYLAMGLLAALLHARATGEGQVIDAAMLDGITSMMTPVYSMFHLGQWSTRRGTNLMDGSCPFGTSYATADGKYMMVAALEPKFYAALVHGLGLSDAELPAQYDHSGWHILHQRFTEVFKSRTRDEWAELLADKDCCASPVLDISEAQHHPHNLARKLFSGKQPLPAAAPRFSLTTTAHAAKDCGTLRALLESWGIPEAEIEAISNQGVSG